MQLDPKGALKPQIAELRGGDVLEDFVAAALSLAGYTVFPDLHIALDGEDTGQIDVFASIQTPFHESRIIVECKGGEPSFEEIRKFASLRSLLDPAPDLAALICKPTTKVNRDKLSGPLRVRLIRRTELARLILPLLGGHAKRAERLTLLNKVMAAFAVFRWLLAQATKRPAKDHLRQLKQEMWWIKEPQQQCEESFRLATETYPRTAAQHAEEKGIDILPYLREANDDELEAAMAVETFHRLLNMYAVTRLALRTQQMMNQTQMVMKYGPRLREAFSAITQNPRDIFGFPAFFEWWIMIWGGVIRKDRHDDELTQLARECSVPLDMAGRYLEVVRRVYGGGQSMVYESEDLIFFKFVPAAFRGIGKLHRQSIGLIAAGESVFRADDAYRNALDRALSQHGGVAGLKWNS